MSRTSGEQLVICPKCGEVNADNFRFCGMCGSVLERALPASAPRVERVRESGVSVALNIPANPPKSAAEKRVEPISGPSLLGLGQPTLDSLREKAFSGSDPLFAVEEPRTGGRKLLLLVLLAALGAATWWTYTNYIAIGESPKRQAPATNAGTSEVPAETPVSEPQASATKSTNDVPAAPPISAATPSPAAVENAPAKVSVPPASKPEVPATAAKPTPRAHEKTVNAAALAKTDQRTPMHDNRMAAPKAAVPVASADNNGDASFRRGEAYLYGRGVAENCDEAIKYLKAASAKQHARARSTFGTMYATGHCVPRDLPTSYSWFALALRVDPNNQILEKDLSAIWNQMTPPERQLATKIRQ